MKELKDLLKLKDKYDKTYYEGNPLVSDEEYDLLIDKIEVLNGKLNVGNKSKKNKVDHLHKMLSLKKYSSFNETISYFNNVFNRDLLALIKPNNEIIVTPKYDGIAIELIYEKHKNNAFKLKDVITRGDGVKGISVINKLKDNVNLLKEINFNNLKKFNITYKTDYNNLSFFAELIPSKDTYREYTKYNKNVKHSRNVTASLVATKLTSNLTKEDIDFLNNLSFKVYTSKDLGLLDYTIELGFIHALGFDVVEYNHYTLNDLSESLDVNYTIHDYVIDGYVLRINDSMFSLSLGETDKYPKYAIAYKPFSKSSSATISNIKYNFNTQGELIPILEINPVELDGSTIRNISISNMSKLYRLNLKIGDKIIIERKGGTVPVVKDVLCTTRDKISIIKVCPKCGTELLKKDNRLFCQNYKKH